MARAIYRKVEVKNLFEPKQEQKMDVHKENAFASLMVDIAFGYRAMRWPAIYGKFSKHLRNVQ